MLGVGGKGIDYRQGGGGGVLLSESERITVESGGGGAFVRVGAYCKSVPGSLLTLRKGRCLDSGKNAAGNCTARLHHCSDLLRRPEWTLFDREAL